MSGILENVKNNLIGYLTVLAITTLIYLAKDIFSYFLPIIFPLLQTQPIGIYLKIIALLMVLVVVLVILIIVFAFKSKSSFPSVISKKFCGINYVAKIDSLKFNKDGEIAIYISWHCPIHKIDLNPSEQIVNNQRIPCLFCTACNKNYFFNFKGAYLNWNAATEIIRDEIYSKINLAHK